MRPIDEILTKTLEEALGTAYPNLEKKVDASAVPSRRPELADYQCNVAMGLAKALRTAPAKIAETIVSSLPDHPIIGKAEVHAPGFINIRLSDAWLKERLESLEKDERLGVDRVEGSPTVVVDYSSPNVSKELHVGHIRSTLLGNVIDRMYRFLGYRVIADSHLGDWGTQFGILIWAYRRYGDEKRLEERGLAELESLYKKGNHECDENPEFREEARRELVKLHEGDPENHALWKRFVDLSRKSIEEIYRRLGVKFDTIRGESAYHSMLPDIVRLLHDKGISRESDGAEVVFFDDNATLSGNPAIVRKRDGAFNYMTTDVATLKHREDEYSPELIVYVTDARQQLHFQQLFEIAKRLGWKTELAHVWFGTILGNDGRPFKTRSGEPPRLMDLLDEAQKRANDVIKQAGADLPPEEEEEVARIVGVGALKYMDLAQNRTSDYVFSYDRMLALDGNTAPYIQYSYARTKSILRKYQERFGPLPERAPILIPEPAERDLAFLLARFPEVIRESARTFYPHVLTDYLYSLATTLNKKFYHSVPVLQSESPVRESRLAICSLVARTLQCGLGLLGIEVPERM